MGYTQEVMMGQKVLDLATQRHQIIANNMANANTPNFKKTDLSFSETLACNTFNCSFSPRMVSLADSSSLVFVSTELSVSANLLVSDSTTIPRF